MKEINAPHEKISKIVRVVDEIAFHTNIPALQAPMETSPPPTEIAAIARRNAENTRRVSGLMAETARRVEDANHSLEERAQSMKEINAPHEKISKIVRVVDEIAF